jgi:hypothetical protein
MSDFCTIISVFPFPVTEVKPGIIGGRYHIPAAPENDIIVYHVPSSSFNERLVGTDRSMKVPVVSDDIARSIVNDFSNSHVLAGEDAKPGMMWVTGKLSVMEAKAKYKAEIETLRGIQHNWFINLAKAADSDWEQYHRSELITSHQRYAAKILGITDRQWLMEYDNKVGTIECPACKTTVQKDAIVCATCKYILNKAEHEKIKTQFA